MISINKTKSKHIEDQNLEIVERKGLGHPDFIADSIAEEFSKRLCKQYIKEHGVILHHNVDKLEVVGGQTIPEFGGGKWVSPILVFFSGRATEVEDMEKVAEDSAKDWISNNLRFLDPENNIKYIVETKRGSNDLVDLYKRGNLGANDTSIGIGYAPYSLLENDVLKIENTLNSKDFKSKFPFVGEDVKVMGVRVNGERNITVATAFVDKFVESEDDYHEKKQILLDEIKNLVDGKIYLNLADEKGRGKDGCYLTISGTSAETGDDGAVGRGNRVNGLIPFNRYCSLEATAGKNPVNHVGKIYNILAKKIAEEIHEEMPETKEIYVKLLSQIGQPLEKPWVANVEYSGEGNEEKIQDILLTNLENVRKISKDIIEGKYSLF